MSKLPNLVMSAVFLGMLSVAFADEEIQTDAKSEACKAALVDELYIVQMHIHGVDIDRMRHKAMNSREMLGEERFQKIMKLVDEAENAVKEGKLEDWLNKYWQACMQSEKI